MRKRFDLNYGSLKRDDVSFPLWYYGKVVSNSDPYDAGRIKVRIDIIDNDVKEENELNDPNNGGLPWCEPLMPKFINVIPRIGEIVKIAVFDYRNKKIRREYIGPVVPQQRPPDLIDSQYFPAKWRVEVGNYWGAWSDEPVSFDGDWKIYPDKDDISIVGRRNTDFILRNKNSYDEVILRAGKIDYNSIVNNQSDNSNQRPTFFGPEFPLNTKNPAYITLNHSLPENSQNTPNINSYSSIIDLNLLNDRTHINLVADNLNLISHKGSPKKGFVKTILKGDDRLTQVKAENEKLHPLPYGDVLWDFLNVLRPYIESHIHKASRREPDGDITKNNLIKWFNDNMGTMETKKSPDGTEYKEIENCNFLSKGVKTN